MIKILADSDIPNLKAHFSTFGELIQKPGREICRQDLKTCDALLVRTVTQVNENLLSDTPVQFVGTVTSGDDHIDQSYLKRSGIAFASAKGANASAVVQYVLSVIAALQQKSYLINKPCVGIVGAGAVGSLLARVLKNLGFEVLLNDPPRAERDAHFRSTPLEALTRCQLICIHAALTTNGPHQSFHLINAKLMQQLTPGTVILNAARGALVETKAILTQGSHLTWCLDVFENEPDIDLKLLQSVLIATPHIAGYSARSKARANMLIAQQLCAHFKIAEKVKPLPQLPTFRQLNWPGDCLAYLNPLQLTKKFVESYACQASGHAKVFDALRKPFCDTRALFEFAD